MFVIFVAVVTYVVDVVCIVVVILYIVAVTVAITVYVVVVVTVYVVICVGICVTVVVAIYSIYTIAQHHFIIAVTILQQVNIYIIANFLLPAISLMCNCCCLFQL